MCRPRPRSLFPLDPLGPGLGSKVSSSGKSSSRRRLQGGPSWSSETDGKARLEASFLGDVSAWPSRTSTPTAGTAGAGTTAVVLLLVARGVVTRGVVLAGPLLQPLHDQDTPVETLAAPDLLFSLQKMSLAVGALFPDMTTQEDTHVAGSFSKQQEAHVRSRPKSATE
ncbi:hypothetical protein HPB52_024845 [Rhipicephalus sanguineus]|uniref:Uncharacterized protein n=1 Tax=Rhipicephalus sanguineus TaxID=34632 RepID=A0A9D4PAF1_RHISA|nr:hypothetical protein HPB52_024845 [Rhipicephalus sanguineus]